MDPPISTPPSPFDSAIILELPEFLTDAPPSSKQATVMMKPTAPSQLEEVDPNEVLEKYIGRLSTKGRKKPPSNIENRIMRRSIEAKSRFAARKKEIEAEKLKEVKSTPAIDPTSRKIAEQNFLTQYFPDKMQTIALIAKSEKPPASEREIRAAAFASPKVTPQSFLTCVHKADFHEERQLSAEREKRETFVMVPRCHVSLPQGSSTDVYLPVRLGPDDKCKLLSPVAELTAFAMLRRAKDEEANAKPKDPLDMTTEDRNRWFVEQKQRKLKEEQAKKQREEARECTFTPSISRLSLAKTINTQGSLSGGPSVSLTDRSKSSQISYTDRYQKKQELMRFSASSSMKKVPKCVAPTPPDMFRIDSSVRIPPPNTMYEPIVPRGQPNPPREDIASPYYAQLSPKAQLLGFKGGCDLEALEGKIKSSRR